MTSTASTMTPIRITSTLPYPNPTLTSNSIPPAKDNRKVKIHTIRLTNPSTDQQIKDVIATDHCKVCDFRGYGCKLEDHAKAHFVRFFCKCGQSESFKTRLCNHIYGARHAGTHQDATTCFMVDADHFEQLIKEHDLPNSTVFGDLIPKRMESMPSVSTEVSSYSKTLVEMNPCRDIRLFKSPEEIAKDREEIKMKRMSQKRPAASPLPQRNVSHRVKDSQDSLSTSTQLPQETFASVVEERDRLRRENAKLATKYSGAKRALKKIHQHLKSLDEMARQVSISQALLECQLGQYY